MKPRLLFCLVIAISICACNQKKSLSIDGAWKMVYFSTINGDKTVIDFPGKTKMDIIKIWSGNRFMSVGQSKVDTTLSDSYGSGTYTLAGNKYEEDVKILMYKPWEGKKIKMLLDLKNDTLIQTYPVDDNGKMDKDWAWIEKYVSIKK